MRISNLLRFDLNPQTLKEIFKIFQRNSLTLFVQEGSSRTCFDHGQFEIKTFPIYARPNLYTSAL